MSITSILNGHTFDDLKEYIRTKAPGRDAFVSNTGYPAFSTCIPIQVTGSTQSTQETALVGEIADYTFCLEILRYVQKQKNINFQNYFRHICAAYTFIRHSDSAHSEIIKRYYPNLQATCFSYAIGVNMDLSKVVEYAYQLYKIENFHRVPRENRDKFWDAFFQPCQESVVRDVIQLVEIFRKCFFEDGVISKKSTIVLHPRLGAHMSPVGIADLYVDGVLYDFKASKRGGYHWKDIGQVYGYYILHKLGLKYSKDTVLAEPVPIKKVDKIALYYSRFGDIETCDLKSCNAVLSSKELAHLAKMMDQHWKESFRVHLEKMTGPIVSND